MHSELIPHSPALDYRPEEENPSIGGFARLAAAVDEIRENKMREGEPVLLFDAGDFLGGAPFAWLALDGYAAELTVMQTMGYDVVTIGNHEYDYAANVLGQYLLQAGYPEAHEKTVVLASNTEAPADHPLAAQGLYRKTRVFELENGLKVGIFGIVGKDAILSMGEAGDMQFLEQHETARQMVDELKAQGADVIVAISHSGVAEDQELAREVPGIDIIVGGQCHTALFEPIQEGTTVIVQAGSLGMYLGQLELAYSSNTGQVRVRNEEKAHPFPCILHDLGRAGLDRRLFGRTWSWARAQGIPTRPREWRVLHPETRYGRETEGFVSRYRGAMEAAGIELNPWACEQVEMRLGYARRLAARLRTVKPRLRELAVSWSPWVSRIMLYYYYPEKLKGAQPWVRQLAEILVACEQFEAYSNQRRGRDYYVRQREDVSEAFAYLDALQGEGIISRPVVQALRELAAEGVFDRVLEEARGRSLSSRERMFLRRAGQESLHVG